MLLVKEESCGAFIDIDGTRTELDHDACAYLRSQLRVYEGGRNRGNTDPLLTTGQAASELGVSRRTLTRMLDRGDIPCERYGNGHRKLRLSDVLHFRETERERRRQAYEELNELYYDCDQEDLEDVEAFLGQFE